MFSQSNKLENYIEPLNNLYEDFVAPILEDRLPGVASFDWENSPLHSGTDALNRCGYDAYESIKSLSNKPTHLNDSIAYSYPEYDKASDSMNEIINILSKEVGIVTLGMSNHPMYYRDYEEHNGFMGWHTNCDYPGDRWYFVYNVDDRSSFFRYIDPDTEQMVTEWEPKGWCLNHFVVGNRRKPLWHCVYTNSHRISFGIRDTAFPGFKQFKWKNVVLR